MSPDVLRPQLQLERGLVDHALEDPVLDLGSEAAVRTLLGLVGQHRPQVVTQVLERVGTHRLRERVAVGAGAELQVRAVVVHDVDVERQDGAVLPEPHLDVVVPVRRMVVGVHDVVDPVLDVGDRSAHLEREEARQGRHLVRGELAPEAPAGGGRHDRQLVRRYAQRRGDQEHEVAEVHRVAVDLEGAVQARPRDGAGGLQRHPGRAAPVQAVGDHQVGLGERTVDVAEVEGPLVGEVRAVCLVEDRRVGGERLDRVDQRWQLVELDVDLVDTVLGGVPRLGDDGDDRLTDVPDLVHGQRVLRDGGGPEVHARVHLGLAVLARDHRDDAGHLQRPRDVDRADVGVRHGAAQDGRVQHAGELQVGDVAATADQQARVLGSAEVLADDVVARLAVGLDVAHRCPSVSAGVDAAWLPLQDSFCWAVHTALTMFW